MKIAITFIAWAILALLAAGSPLRASNNDIDINHDNQNARWIPGPHLERRYSKHLGNGWWMHYDTWVSLLPWGLAAEGIEEFFNVIVERANGEWLNQNPQHYFKIMKGGLMIEFYSELVPVAWPFIAYYADAMRRALDLGFAGMFDMRIVDPAGVVVYVHLRVRQALLAAAAA